MDIDSFLVGVYLALVLCIGIFNQHAKNFQEYALARNTYPTFFLVATIVATFIGSVSTSEFPEQTQNHGIITITLLCADVGYLLMMSWLAGRIHRYKNVITIGDIIGQFWGRESQMLGGLLGGFYLAMQIGTQIAGMGLLVNAAFGLNYYSSTVIGCAVLVFYSTIGGIKAVVYTDVLQFFMLIITISVIFFIGLDYVPGGFKGLWHNLPESHKSFNADPILRNQYLWASLTILLPILNPSIVQRILMAPSAKVARRSYLLAAITALPIYLLLIGIGLVSYNISNGDHLLNNIMLEQTKDLLPIGLKGFAIAGILAIIMSTADSHLNAGSVLLTHDLVDKAFSKPLSEKNKILICKAFTFIIGVGALHMALKVENVITLALLPYNFWGPVNAVPTLFALFGVIGSRFCFFATAASGVITIFFCKYFGFYTLLFPSGKVAPTLEITSIHQIFSSAEPAIPAIMVSCMVYYLTYLYEKMQKAKDRPVKKTTRQAKR